MHVLGVASGPHVYLYKNLRPFFKFTVPSENADSTEAEVWGQAKEALEIARAMGSDSEFSADALVEMLNGLKVNIGEENLTARSQHLLSLPKTEWSQFITESSSAPLKKQTVICCITTLKKAMRDDDSPSCLVIATENRHIYILDPEAFTILEDIKVNDVSASLATSGLYDVDYCVFSACRSGCICVAERGTKEAELLIAPGSLILGFVIVPPPSSKANHVDPSTRAPAEEEVRVGASIVVALSNQKLQSYSRQGKKYWEIMLPSHARAIITVPLIHLGLTLVAVALAGGTVNFYHEKMLVDVMKFQETVSALAFGSYGQEENTLVAVTYSGILHVKILKRTSRFGVEVTEDGQPVPQKRPKDHKLSIPKRTKEFVEHAAKERDNAIQIHQTFQRDLLHMRKVVDRAYQDNVNKCRNVTSAPDNPKQLKLTVQLHGLGPVFKAMMTLETISPDAVQDIALTFHWDPRIYSIDQPFIKVPYLAPNFPYHLETFIRLLTETPISDKVTVIVVDTSEDTVKVGKKESVTSLKGSKKPKKTSGRRLATIITTIINMPLSEDGAPPPG
ncbi:Bardet-Biedl syndrome 1 protein homolog isoform X2 [Ischnura elegans]|uniref:Bardet-Biedl syndrome 1 protein homolog isoform X2 n=1 Tax=Ischnura elegans TaxID=197161 RepID=UPI001ED89298|nr:Bardet-Biedl syndrome 1 protein homolog isoform X2 [Ischnura elegans]